MAVLVVIGMPIWGSDVGGILAFTPTILVFAALVYRRRHPLAEPADRRRADDWRRWSASACSTWPGPRGSGPTSAACSSGWATRASSRCCRIMERKLLANLRVTTSSFWVAAIPVAIAFLVFLARYPGRPLDGLRRSIPTLQAGLVAAYVAAVLGSVVNDSGAIVGGVTLRCWPPRWPCWCWSRDARQALDHTRRRRRRPSRRGAGARAAHLAEPSRSRCRAPGADGRLSAAPADVDRDAVPRSLARWLVGGLFVLLLVPGLVGFDAWPLTGWRLFTPGPGRRPRPAGWWRPSTPTGRRLVDLEELPLRYRHAEWPMADLPGASTDRRQAVCRALAGAVADVEPGDRRAAHRPGPRRGCEERDGDWAVVDDLEVIHTCRPADLEGAGA